MCNITRSWLDAINKGNNGVRWTEGRQHIRRAAVHGRDLSLCHVLDELTWNLEVIVTEIEYRLLVSALPDILQYKYGPNASKPRSLFPSFKR